MRIERAHVVMGVKVALGAALAIALANLLGLQYSATAGIITVLSILGTKRETLRIAGGRLMAFLAALAIAFACYSLLGYNLLGFAAYLFVFAVVCYACAWAYALSMVSVLVAHFMSAGTMDGAMLLNEALLFVIGTGCGILVNLHLHADDRRMLARLNAVDALMKETLLAMARLPQNAGEAADMLERLQVEITGAGQVVLQSAGNQLIGQPMYEIHYVQMRSNQRKILSQIHAAMGRIDALTPQHGEVCALFGKIAGAYHMDNDVSALLSALEALLADMRAQALPVSRAEFESRAVLYYVLLRVQDFLQLKR
ncbi:MAG: hypothetical protein IJ438_14400 [Clostridia bacterium]|nr:hypothetical protein [Clostridia bacterium]